MPTFLIISDKPNPPLEKTIKEAYPDDCYIISKNHWLIDAEETTGDLAEELGVRDGSFGKVIVFRVDSYSGYHSKNLWEWLTLP